MAVAHLPAEQRYVIRRDGEIVGELLYAEEGGKLLLTHTEVRPELRHQGLGHELVIGALADIRARGLHVVPLCRFVATYFLRHPEEGDLLADGLERRTAS